MKKDNPDSSLLELLGAYNQNPPVAMHMPGHKRNLAMLGDALPWQLDVTEIPPFDDLHRPEGLLLSSMERAARLFGSRRCFYLVGGSSCGLLAAIRAAAGAKGTVIVARNCHQSVFHAIELCGAMPLLVEPEYDAELGLYGSVKPETIAAAVNHSPDAAAVIVTSPTYEGVVSDIAAISGLLSGRDIPLIVDEAHGAHLPFSGSFPKSAVQLGADCVVQSLHKTLPSLTQTAVLHLCSGRIPERELSRQLRIFQSSSPSYVLISSIDCCIRALEKSGELWFSEYTRRLERLYESLRPLRRLEALTKRGFFDRDPSKLVISGRRLGVRGSLLSRSLLELGVQCEMSGADYAVLMTSVCDTDESLAAVADAVLRLDETVEAGDAALFVPPPGLRQIISPLKAMQSAKTQLCPLEDCEGKLSAEYLWAYPPGIPWLLPGQLLTGELLDSIRAAESWGIELRSTSGEAGKIRIDLAPHT